MLCSRDQIVPLPEGRISANGRILHLSKGFIALRPCCVSHSTRPFPGGMHLPHRPSHATTSRLPSRRYCDRSPQRRQGRKDTQRIILNRFILNAPCRSLRLCGSLHPFAAHKPAPEICANLCNMRVPAACPYPGAAQSNGVLRYQPGQSPCHRMQWRRGQVVA